MKEGETSRPKEREATLERLRAENVALRAELERMRARYEVPVDPPARRKKSKSATEPELFALVGPGPQGFEEDRPPYRLWDSAGPTLCRILEGRNPESRWSYYGDERSVPEGVTYFYALEALQKLWGPQPGNPDPPTPKGYRRLTAAEHEERDSVQHAALRHIDETLERSQTLYGRGQEVAAVGLLKYADVLLARFNLALARAKAGDAGWRGALSDPVWDAEVEAWVAAQIAGSGQC